MRRWKTCVVVAASVSFPSELLIASCGFLEAELTGSVFIVTRGGANVKLGLVEVRAIPERDIRPFIEAKQATFDSLMQECLLELAQIDLEEAEELRGHRYALEEREEVLTVAKQKARASLLDISADNLYFRDLPVGVATAKTDADGEFSMRLRRGKYALGAKASRQAMDRTEEYYWLVWVTLSGKSTRVFLSNDNLLASGSPLSVVTPTD